MSKIIKEVPDTSLITDISASLGIIQFNQLNSFLEKRSAVKEVFSVSLSKGDTNHFTAAKIWYRSLFLFPFFWRDTSRKYTGMPERKILQ